MAVVVEVLADLPGHVRQLGREFAPFRVLDDLLQRDFVVHAGQAGFVLPPPEKGNQQPPLFRFETEDEIVAAGFRLHVRGKKVAEALLPVRAGGRGVFRVALFLAQFFHQAQSQGRHMAADARESVGAVALVARAAVGDGKAQAGRIDLQVAALDDALHVPGLAFLDIYFLHLSLGEDIVGRVADVLRHAVVQESLAHFANDALF